MKTATDTGHLALRSTWKAVVWDEGLALIGLVFVAAAAASSLQDCTVSLGCADGSSPSDGTLLLLIAIGLIPLTGASFVAASLSGWPSAGRATVAALVAFLASLTIGIPLSRVVVDSYLPALTLALAIQGAIAVRAPATRAVRARVVVVVLLVLASCLFAAESAPPTGTLLIFVLLAIPAIGVADTLARVLPHSNRR